jgi:hypothetical protein
MKNNFGDSTKKINVSKGTKIENHVPNVSNITHKQREILRKKVLAMLRDPDPVKGIYAMYGAHERPPLCCQKK